MKHISSRDNPAVKALVKLAGLAGRRGASVLLDGVHLCRAWLDHRGLPEQAVFDAERLDQPELAAPGRRAAVRALPALDARLMQSLASVESGQGVAFVVAPPAPALPGAVDENCVLFDRIQDPGNVGTLLRTCAAAGIKRVFLATGTAAAWSPKVLRSGQGAHFALAIHEHVDLAALLRACARRWWRRRWTAPATCTAPHCRSAAPGCSDMKGRAWTRACWPPRP